MAITIIDRPRQLVYYTSASPAEPVYSTWNAGWNPIVYSFNVLAGDITSSIVMTIYEFGTNALLASNTLRPFRTGAWNVDVSPYLRAYLFSTYKPGFSVYDNGADAGNSIKFYITYTQLFDDGSASIFNTDQSNIITAMASAMQFKDANGGNMSQYTPFNFDLPEDAKMKFLTLFDKPVMWEDWPFSMSFIYSLNILGVQCIKGEYQQDINGNQIDAENTNLNPFNIGSVNYLKINKPSNENTRFVLIDLKTGDTIENTYVDNGYVDTGYTQIQ